MKYVIFALAWLLFLVLGAVARGLPRLRYGLCFLLGFTPVLPQSINFVSHELYRGSSRGFEITLVDLVCWSVLLAVPKGEPRATFPLRIHLVLLLGAAFASTLASEFPLYSYFGLWKMLRGALLAWAGFRVATHSNLSRAVVRGLCFSAAYCVMLALADRYVFGLIQAMGPFPHQNAFAGAENNIFPLALALVLAGVGGRIEMAAVLLAPLGVVIALSRAGLALFVFGAGVTFLISLSQRVSLRKVGLLALGMFGAMAVLVKAADTIVERFMTASAKSAEARVEFEEVGRLMNEDFPLLGVGPNMYSFQSQYGGYGERVGLVQVDIGGIMHNIYQLSRAELGIIGYLPFLALLFSPLILGTIAYLRDKDLVRKNMILGLTVGLGVTLLHGNLEWTLQTAQVGSVFWLTLGVLVGLYKKAQLTGWREAPRESY